jgi:hypothetical protein
MAFLDNSGDIILDVVLTDHGRKVLSRGDGSFQITKFALCDEEIDYSLYNKTHASGSSYYDLEILQTPILEAFTDNASSMKTRLMTYDNLELLFLPVMRLNTIAAQNRQTNDAAYYICVNRETEDNSGSDSVFSGVGVDFNGKENDGFIFGESLRGSAIMVDQGLDTTEISPQRKLDGEMTETSFVVQLDDRLGKLVDVNGSLAEPDYVDDDNIAFYTLDLGDSFVKTITSVEVSNNVIKGPRGSRIQFRIMASMDLNTSSYLFTTLGGTDLLTNRTTGGSTKSSVLYIDTTVRISGVKTGAFIDVPIRYIRLS